VLGRRDDGYHEVESLLVSLPWGDEVDVVRVPEPVVTLALEGTVEVPAGRENLAVRAAEAALAATGAKGGAHVTLVKRVPVGMGLGGGSADAAAVLRALAGDLPPADLHALARGLGADVPFCLVGGAAVARGIGDVLEPLPPAPPLEIVLVCPRGLANATAAVYARADCRRPAPPGGLERARHALLAGDAAALRAAHHNGLAIPAMAAYPAFLRFVSGVERRWGRPPAVTGSGAAVYDVVDPGEGEAVAARVADLPADVRVLPLGAPRAGIGALPA
jgi:4-diphosphocytidyl-2-C-methyl-D-erythritol kinase